MDERPDDILMQKVREGDVAKLAILFERHHQPLFAHFVRLTGDREGSEDLVQDVFFRVLKYRHTFQDGSSFRAWMYQVARNAWLDSTRKRKGEVLMIDDPERNLREPASTAADPSEAFHAREQARLMRRALASLPVEKREVLLLSRFQNLKYEQIAEILACDIGAVKVRVYRAVKALGQIFLELSGEKAS
ncbi:MAG TPA: RNA polymerase sigma factor [Bryobacteraceae bacterium]|nr:RNA polymerase sigma factor [Bryobacteraceae bacterium]